MTPATASDSSYFCNNPSCRACFETRGPGAWVGDLSEDQRREIAGAFGLEFWSLDECERLEAALGYLGIGVVTQWFPDDVRNDDTDSGWCCDLQFTLRDEQPAIRHMSGRGEDRTRSVLSATWAALISGEVVAP